MILWSLLLLFSTTSIISVSFYVTASLDLSLLQKKLKV